MICSREWLWHMGFALMELWNPAEILKIAHVTIGKSCKWLCHHASGLFWKLEVGPFMPMEFIAYK